MNMKTFSFFDHVTNVTPTSSETLRSVALLIASTKYKDTILTLRATADEKQRKLLKKGLPIVTFSGVFTSRRNSGLSEYSEFLCLDFDHISENIEEIEELKIKIMDDDDNGALVAFVSPSGTGLKVVVWAGSEVSDHVSVFKQYATFFKNTYGLIADEACKDVARACYLSYDPNLIIKDCAPRPSWLFTHIYMPATSIIIPQPSPRGDVSYTSGDLDKLRDIADQCVNNNISIANDYASEYFPIIAGIASSFGKEGEIFARDICSRSPKYDAREFEYTFDKILSGVTPNNHYSFASVIDIAHRYGIYYNNVDIEENEELSNITDIAKLFENTPRPLSDLIKQVESLNEKVVVFFTLLSALSCLFPYTFFYHSKKKYYLNIACLIIGNSGTGKGRSSLSESFLFPFDEYLHGFAREDKNPPYFLTEASDLSEAMLYLDLAFNQANPNKGSAFMLSSELDNVSKGKKKEHGVSSAIIRMITEHEPLRQKRKGLDPRANARDREGFYIAEPKMSFLFCGTEDQIPNYFTNNTNGETARFIPLFLDGSEDYRSGFNSGDSVNLSDLCKTLAKENYLELWQNYISAHYEFQLVNSENQIKNFDNYFSELKLKYVKTNDNFSTIVNRIPVHFRRVAGILQMLRFWNAGSNPPLKDISIEDDVWAFTLQLFELLIPHFYRLHNSSSSLKSLSVTDKILLYELPDNFTYSEAVKIATKFKYSDRTLRRHLSSLIKYHKIVRDYHGNYSKV